MPSILAAQETTTVTKYAVDGWGIGRILQSTRMAIWIVKRDTGPLIVLQAAQTSNQTRDQGTSHGRLDTVKHVKLDAEY